MIVLWGLIQDAPLALVKGALDVIGAAAIFLDQRRLLDMHMELDTDGTGFIDFDGREIPLSGIVGLYLRPYDPLALPEFDGCAPDSTEARHAETLIDLMWTWAEIADVTVINRPSAMSSNNCKPHQLEMIRDAGLFVPATLITTDSEEARDFVAKHGQAIYKSISGTRSIVGLYGEDERLELLQWCPTQFQEFIEGTDYRVHVVRDSTFACEIRSNAVDYRYGAYELHPYRIPEEIEQRCLALSRRLSLPVCGIDLRRTADDRWFCFEVNPSPAHSCFEGASGGAISIAIARLLVDADQR